MSAPAPIFSFIHPLPGTHVHPGVAMHFFIAYDEGDFLLLLARLWLLLFLARVGERRPDFVRVDLDLRDLARRERGVRFCERRLAFDRLLVARERVLDT